MFDIVISVQYSVLVCGCVAACALQYSVSSYYIHSSVAVTVSDSWYSRTDAEAASAAIPKFWNLCNV